MTLSIKSIGGIINEPPEIINLQVTGTTEKSIRIEYSVKDPEHTIVRHFLTVKTSTQTIMNRVDITKDVGVEEFFSYNIKGLLSGTSYTIQIFCTDGHDEVKSNALAASTLNDYLYGVKVMENNSNPNSTVTYLEEAINISPATSNSLGGWAKKAPFNSVRIVGFKDGKVTKEINPNNKTQYKDGSTVSTDVDVMVEIPKIYWKFTNISNGYELRISNNKFDGADCYAHKVSGVEKDYIYVGAYLGYNEGGKLRSRSGVSPTSTQSISTFRQQAQANGSGYQQWNWYTLMLLQILYLIAYKNLNSQQALGMGVCSSKKTNTGGTNTKGMIFGSSNQGQQVCFLGIEDIWGNLSQWVDGMYFDGSWVSVISDNKNFNDNRTSFEHADSTREVGYGQISKVVHSNKSGFFPKENSGSQTTYYCDYTVYFRNNFATSGGGYQSGLNSGIFYLVGNIDVSSTDVSLGSRLCYLG